MTRKRWLAWVPTILIMIIIFLFSSENSNESSNLSGSLTKSMVEAVINAADLTVTSVEQEHIIESIHTPVRKVGHLSEYAMLGITVAFALIYCHRLRGRRLYLVSIGFCVLYASSDEFHQFFTPGRSPMITDVGIDTFGAIIGILLCTQIYRHINRKKNVKNYP